MKRRVSAFFMVFVMLLTMLLGVIEPISAKAEEGPVIRLHYHREDGDYEPWNVWFWAEGQEGAVYEFEELDGEMVSTFPASSGTTSVGFIVRTEDWTKDVNADQFIDISDMISGAVDIYVESGVEGYTKTYADGAVTGTKLRSAKYNGDGTITVVMTTEIPGEFDGVFSVAGRNGDIAVKQVTYSGDSVYEVVLEQELEISNHYSITFEGTSNDIQMPSIYSTPEFEATYTYEGDDLGANWTKDKTVFRVWAPTAESVQLNLYASGTEDGTATIEQIAMTADVNGTWVAEKEGDLNGTYYTFSSTIDGTTQEACDPYARTTGVNGARAMVIDLDSTNPEGWASDVNPHAGETMNDAIIYEGHVRDLTMGSDTGITNGGKYLGLIETGTKTTNGISTGLDHIKELGITHLHIMPMYDFGSVDETKLDENSYNWGYDPVNFNVPEGSYSTDPYHGEVRVSEVKQMVMGLHENGISVVMDVVYNHVMSASDFSINKLVPGYFSRINSDGTYSNGSGCANDTATERSMVKKYIIDSVTYWADEYHIDGFRFDLVGLIDVDTINEVMEAVHETHPDVIFYGEGWTLDTTPTKSNVVLATQPNSDKTPGFAYFNDTIRDGLKGNVFDNLATGFVSGLENAESKITSCFMAADVWCTGPSQTINYASCHDNNTMFDRLQNSRQDASKENIIRMNNLAAAIYLTAEGIPFMQAGEEMLRTKLNADGSYNSNSYNAGDAVNALDWNSLADDTYAAVFDYYKGLIAFRKAHSALRLQTADEVAKYVSAVEGLDSNMVGFTIKGGMEGETAEEIFLIFNANEEAKKVTIPEGEWSVCINDTAAGCDAITTISGETTVAPISALVLVKNASTGESETTPTKEVEATPTSDAAQTTVDTAKETNHNGTTIVIVAIIAAVVVGAGVVVIIVRKKNKKQK